VREFTDALPDDPTLVLDDQVLDGATLRRRVEDLAATFDLPERSLVVLEGGNDAGFVTTYLALLVAGHVPLLTGRHGADLAARWGADALARSVEGEVTVSRRRGDHADLHPDLALLLSTSGSTGSPRLVRLSQANLAANARSIAAALGLTAADRAITTLPLHYCYGLSVLHSHLVAGAAVVVADVSVVDPCCWRAVRRHGVTNLAGVPHSFELLERAGIDPFDETSVRFLTQAGGRMEPDRVRQWAATAERHGRELFVMYGQTEATARMAVLPPALASVCPGAVGQPIPGGSFELRPHEACDLPDVGELVYRGANVMMGYATEREHLAVGPQLSELATGDLARYDAEHDVFEVVGRVSRFIKPFGVRVDLGMVERTLAARGVEAVVDGDDTGVAVLVTNGDGAAARTAVVELTGLPVTAIAVVADVLVPRTPSGKVDGAEVRRMARANADDAASEQETAADVYRSVLGVASVAPDDTFVGLGGDSLSYIECSLRLETVLGTMPPDWHLRPVGELESRRGVSAPRLDTTIVLRALAICAIVATHMRLIRLPGGAHLLLAVAGYNLARFQLNLDDTMARIRSGLLTAARVAVPTSLWVAANLIIGGTSTVAAAMLVSNWTAPGALRDTRWRYWFVEAFVALVVVVTLLLAISAVRRLERRWPFGFPTALLLPCLIFRFPWWDASSDPSYVYRTYAVAFFFMLGWMAMQASRTSQRLLVSALAVVLLPGYFGLVQRDWVVVVGLVTLVWLPALPVPRRLHSTAGALASASMWIYLVHYQVWRPLAGFVPRIPLYVFTMFVGVMVWRGVIVVQRRLAARSSARERDHGVAEHGGVQVDIVHGVVGRHEGHVVEGGQQDPPVDRPQVHEGVEVVVDGGSSSRTVARRRAEPVLGASAKLLHRPRKAELVDGGLHAGSPGRGHGHHDREVGLA
jgi:hypothetical protein